MPFKLVLIWRKKITFFTFFFTELEIDPNQVAEDTAYYRNNRVISPDEDEKARTGKERSHDAPVVEHLKKMMIHMRTSNHAQAIAVCRDAMTLAKHEDKISNILVQYW